MTIFSLTIILPVNFRGNQGDTEQKFAHTTIANLPPEYVKSFFPVRGRDVSLQFAVIVGSRLCLDLVCSRWSRRRLSLHERHSLLRQGGNGLTGI